MTFRKVDLDCDLDLVVVDEVGVIAELDPGPELKLELSLDVVSPNVEG